MSKYNALVVGVGGIIGNAVVRELQARPDWTVRALPRTFVDGVETIQADLTDAAATARALGAARDTTHVFYAALRSGSDLLDEEHGGERRHGDRQAADHRGQERVPCPGDAQDPQISGHRPIFAQSPDVSPPAFSARDGQRPARP